jgi:hypothetical protein
MKKPTKRKSNVPRDAVPVYHETPHIPGVDDYELPDEVIIDYSKAKPNRFAGRIKYQIGGVRKTVGEPVERHTVTLIKSHVKYLRRLDANLSRAIRKLIESQRIAK